MVLFSLVGDLLIVKKRYLGFVLWVVCDTYFCLYHFGEQDYAESALFLIFMLFAVYGFYEWRFKRYE